MSEFIVTPKGVFYNLDAIASAEPQGDGRLSVTLVSGFRTFVSDADGTLRAKLASKLTPAPAVPTPSTVCKQSNSPRQSSPKATSPTKS